jgi:hypothetical protein
MGCSVFHMLEEAAGGDDAATANPFVVAIIGVCDASLKRHDGIVPELRIKRWGCTSTIAMSS